MIQSLLLVAPLALSPGHAHSAESANASVALRAPMAVSALDWGVKLMADKKYPEAIAKLEREARVNPGSSELLLNLGWAYWHAGRIEDARRVGSMLLKLDPRNRVFMIFMANTNIERKDYAAAVELMHRALTQAPDDRDASMVLARALFLDGRRMAALSVIEGVITRLPGDAGAMHRRAMFLAEMGRKREALAVMDSLLRAEPANVSYRRSRAKVLSELGRQEEAKNEWRRLTRKEADAQSLLNLGWAHWREKNYDAAWEIAATLVKLDDKNPTFLRFMANQEIERQNYQSALRLAQKVLLLAPGDRDAGLTLSKALFRLQRVREAMAIIRGLIVEHPDNPAVQYRWAELLAGTKQYDQALFYFDRLLQADPGNVTYRMNRAHVLYEMGRYDEGIAEWKSMALQSVPNMDALRRLRDDAFNRKGWDDALAWQMRLIADSPLDPAGWESLCNIYRELGQLPKALWAAERAIAVDPVSINAYYMKAEILEKMGDWPAAMDAYEDIIRRNPNSVRAIDGLAYAQEARRDYAGALDSLGRIEALTAPSVSPYIQIEKARFLADSGHFARALKILQPLAADRRTLIPALLYHGIGSNNRGDSIPQDVFREQLSALKRKGYQAITATELNLVYQGKSSLPEKPILITFDDARTDSFENADPVLKEMGFRATMFVHVSKRRRSYFHADHEDIVHWQATGRWDMQAHGSQAHDPMPLDEFGHTGHFLPNRMWLAEAGRLETLAEYRARVDNDYLEAKSGVEEIVAGHQVVAFAFPFGDYGQNDYSNTPDAAKINQALVKKRFRLAFVQEQYGINTISSNPTDLRRFEVPRYMTAQSLMTHLASSDPRVRAKMLLAQMWMRAEQPGRARAIYSELAAQGVDESFLLAERGMAFMRGGDIAYARGLFAQAAAREAGAEGGLGRKLLAQAEHAAAPVVAAEVQRFTDSDTNAASKAVMRVSGMVRSLLLEAWAGQGEYSDRRQPSAPPPLIRSREGGVQLRFFPGRDFELAGFYARRSFTWGAAGFTDNYSIAASWQMLPELRATLRDGMGNVETAEGIRRSRTFHSDGAGLAWDPALNWKVFADYDRSRYNDSNLQQDVRLRLMNKFTEWGSVGAVYYHGQSKGSRPEYYTPRSLNQYTGMLSLNRSFGEINPRTGNARAQAQLQYEGGYGFQKEGSRGVQSVRASLGLRLFDGIFLGLSGQYAQSPAYISRRAEGALAVTF